MNHSFLTITKIVGLWICANFLFPSVSNAQLFPLSDNDWSNPEFVKRYMGSYGMDGELSPEVTEAESLVMQDLAPFIEDDVENGIFFLLPKITEESSAAMNFMMGQLYLESENPEEAINSYSRAIRKFPTFLRAYKNLALAYMQTDDCDGAMPHLNKVLEMGQADGLTYGFLGYCNIQYENYSSAMSAYAMARLFEPDKNNWKIGLAQASMQAKKYQDAIVILDELIKQDPENPSLLMLQVNAYLAIDDQESTLATLEILSRLGASTGTSLLLLGDLYVRNEIPSLAIKSYLAALDQDERPNFERSSRALTYFAQNDDWQNASNYLVKLKSVYESELTPQEQISLMVLEAQVAQGNEQYSAAALLLAQNHKNSGDYERAEFYFDRAAKVDEFAFEALTDNARMAVSFRKLSRALSLLEKANNIRPSSTIDNNIRILKNALNVGGQ